MTRSRRAWPPRAANALLGMPSANVWTTYMSCKFQEFFHHSSFSTSTRPAIRRTSSALSRGTRAGCTRGGRGSSSHLERLLVGAELLLEDGPRAGDVRRPVEVRQHDRRVARDGGRRRRLGREDLEQLRHSSRIPGATAAARRRRGCRRGARRRRATARPARRRPARGRRGRRYAACFSCSPSARLKYAPPSTPPSAPRRRRSRPGRGGRSGRPGRSRARRRGTSAAAPTASARTARRRHRCRPAPWPGAARRRAAQLPSARPRARAAAARRWAIEARCREAGLVISWLELATTLAAAMRKVVRDEILARLRERKNAEQRRAPRASTMIYAHADAAASSSTSAEQRRHAADVARQRRRLTRAASTMRRVLLAAPPTSARLRRHRADPSASGCRRRARAPRERRARQDLRDALALTDGFATLSQRQSVQSRGVDAVHALDEVDPSARPRAEKR